MNFKKFNTYDEQEIKIAIKVIKSGKLSGFIGEWQEEFYGGKYVNLMEKNTLSFLKLNMLFL